MALRCLTFIFLLNSIFLVHINCDNDFHENLDEFYRPQIWSLVNYLNANPRRVYNYNYATLINAQNKDIDNTDLTIDVEVECRNLRSNQCVTSLEECHGTVRYNTETANYQVSSASCNPKTRIDLNRNDDSSETTRYEEENIEENVEQPVEESVVTEKYYAAEVYEISEKPAIKVTVTKPGCTRELDTSAKYLRPLVETAIHHIESEDHNKHVLVKILRAQSEIINGFRYILLMEIARTDCPKTIENPDACQLLDSKICRVFYLQLPGARWKYKDITSNNCTQSNEYAAHQPTMYTRNDQDNEIDRNYYPGKPRGYPDNIETNDRTNYDSIADGNPDDILKIAGGIMDPSRMKDLESQIIYMQTEDTSEAETTTGEVSVFTDDQKSALDDFLGMMGDESRRKRSTKDDDSSSSSSSSSSEEDNNNNDDDDNDDEEKTKRKTKKYKKQDKNDDNNNDDDSSSSSSSSSEEDNDDNGNGKKHKNKKAKRQAPEDSSASSEENNEDNRAKRQAVSSESSQSSEEKKDSTTAVPVAENKVSSEESSSEEHRGGVRRKRSLGQTEQLVKVSPEEKNYVENLADFSATTLDDIDADNHKRIVLQILGAKKNPSETLYHLTLRVGISKCPEENDPVIDLQQPNRKDHNCRNKLFENLTKICKVQIRVDDDKTNPKVEKSHCQNIKKDQDDTIINRTGRSKREDGSLLGGIQYIPNNDSKIVEYAKNILKELDANEGVTNKRKFITILSASQQVVSGMRYRIKIKFTEHDKEKICDFDIWDQPWVKPNGKSVSVKCGEDEKKFRCKRSHHHQELLGKDDHDVHIGIFKSYMDKFNKKYYNKSEFKKRFRIFRENMKIIKNLNDNEQGTAKYGPTIFADLSKDEYKRYLGLKPSLHNSNNIPMPQAQIPDIDLKPEFDWRKKGIISEVKNQGSCGSCWAFSVTGNIEGLNAIKTGNLVELSEQELVDCDKLDSGCNGGLPDNAYRAIEQLGGLETETDYPYEAEDEKCHFNKTLTKVQISGAVNISSDETDMAKWLVKNGPISIGINANAMQFYMGGVSHPWKFLCDPTNLDHGVLIVGYGVHKYPLFKKELPYWIIKNSWGPTWGEQGYYRVYRGDGTCGVNKMASSAVL